MPRNIYCHQCPHGGIESMWGGITATVRCRDYPIEFITTSLALSTGEVSSDAR